MKKLLLVLLSSVVITGCSTVHRQQHKNSLVPEVDNIRLLRDNRFSVVSISVLSEDIQYPIRTVWNLDDEKPIYLDNLGRRINPETGKLYYADRVADRNKSFKEVPIVYPLIQKFIRGDGSVTVKNVDQLGREVKIQAL